MTHEAVALGDAMRIAVGSRLGHMQDLIGDLRSQGIKSARLDELERVVSELSATAGAPLPRPSPGVVQALLAQLLVVSFELRPSQLGGYGTLSEPAAQLLQRESGRLQELVSALIDDLDLTLSKE